MTSIDDTKRPEDRLDRFLAAAPDAVPPGAVVGIDDFLAAPPIPAEPPPPVQAGEDALPLVADFQNAPPPAEEQGAPPRPWFDAVDESADLPIIEPFPVEPDAPPTQPPLDPGAVAEAADALIEPPKPDLLRAALSDPAASPAADAAANGERGGGGDVSAPKSFPLDDRLIADPADLLSAAPWPTAAPAPPSSVPERAESWSSGTPDAGPQPTPSRADFSRVDPVSAREFAGWGPSRGDDRSTAGSDALDRLESRLAGVVARLEEAAAAAAASGPASLGTRPRGFRGRIDS